MFANERLDQILEILNSHGKLIVKDLSLKFSVTEDCIRKDLKNLENKNLLKRTYGGAIPARKSTHNENIQRRKSVNMESKQIIAEKAFNLIEDNETIFMDISTSNIIFAKLLADSTKHITVVTNMIDIISTFSNNNIINVICTGGVFSNKLDGFTGSAAIECIQKYKVDRVFIGSCGVNVFDKSITTFDVEDGNTKKAIINAGKNVYLLMDNSKFYADGIYKFASLYDINYIITESRPAEEICEILDKTDTGIL